jgi:uncharacterized protein (TIGR02145 family)
MKEVYTYRGFTGVKIGDQFWMNKNLDVGDGINNPDHPEFGKYYTWDQAMKAIPDGWRLPSIEDFEELKKFLGNNSATFILNTNNVDKEVDRFGNESFEGVDVMNLNILLSGRYVKEYVLPSREHVYNIFQSVNKVCNFWSSTEDNRDDKLSFICEIYHSLKYINIAEEFKTGCISVRCVQDWNIVKEWLNNQEVELDDLELDNIEENNLNESMKFFKLSEKYL